MLEKYPTYFSRINMNELKGENMRRPSGQLFVIENKNTGEFIGKFTESEALKVIENNNNFHSTLKKYSTKVSDTTDIIFVNATVHGTYTVKKTEEEALSCKYGSGCSVTMAVKYFRVN